MNFPSSTPRGPRRKASRAATLVIIGGLASGAAFAAVTGISSAAGSTGPSTASPGASAPVPAPAESPGWARHRGRFGMGGRFGVGGPGGGGTVTAINGTTLTLRTENGTETVDTTPSTTFTKELRPVGLSAVRVGDVVHVAGHRPTASATQVPPGTGTVTASRVVIVEPALTGRVTAVAGTTISLVGRDGKLLTVETTPSTRYYTGSTSATAAAVTVGSRIVAEGARNSLTHLTADLVVVRPAGAKGGLGARRATPGPWGPGPDRDTGAAGASTSA